MPIHLFHRYPHTIFYRNPWLTASISLDEYVKKFGNSWIQCSFDSTMIFHLFHLVRQIMGFPDSRIRNQQVKQLSWEGKPLWAFPIKFYSWERHKIAPFYRIALGIQSHLTNKTWTILSSTSQRQTYPGMPLDYHSNFAAMRSLSPVLSPQRNNYHSN